MLHKELPPAYFTNFMQFRELYRIITQQTITDEDYTQVEYLARQFVREFERLYYNNDPKFLSVCTVQNHYLLHLAENIRDFGPPCRYAQLALEQFLRVIKSLAKSTSKPYVSLTGNLLLRERVIYAKLNMTRAPDDVARDQVATLIEPSS